MCAWVKVSESWKQNEYIQESNTQWISPLATTQDNLDDKLRKFEIRDMMGLTDDRDISETVSETWSTDVLGSDFDPNMDEDRLQEIAGGQTLCFPRFLSIRYLSYYYSI